MLEFAILTSWLYNKAEVSSIAALSAPRKVVFNWSCCSVRSGWERVCSESEGLGLSGWVCTSGTSRDLLALSWWSWFTLLGCSLVCFTFGASWETDKGVKTVFV